MELDLLYLVVVAGPDHHVVGSAGGRHPVLRIRPSDIQITCAPHGALTRPATGFDRLGDLQPGAPCGDPGETSVVNPIQSTISTHQSVFPNDSAAIGGGGSGTVHLRLYAGATCDGTVLVDETPNVVNGTAATSNTTVSVDANGTYSWLVEYSGDATHTGATSTCSTEHFDVNFTNG